MKLIFHGKSDHGGIYRILNMANGRTYIGSTYSFYKRAYNHLNNLVANRHKNTFLQNDFNKCGKDVFLFEVVETVEGKQSVRLEREQFFIDQHYDNQKQCYNLTKTAIDSRTGTQNRNGVNPLTDKRCKSPSPEVLAKRSLRIKEVKSSPEQREKAKQNALNCRWKDRDANIEVVNMTTKEEATIHGSIRQWCTNHNLSYKSFHLMVQGKTKSSGGWYLKHKGMPVVVSQKGTRRKPLSSDHRALISSKLSKGKYVGIILFNEMTGNEIMIRENTNMKEIAKEHGLYYTTLLKVMNKECKSVSGWKIKTHA